MTMSIRERYFAALLFGEPDCIPLSPGHPRESTLRAWHTQGLPEDRNYYDVMLEELGLPPMSGGWEGVEANFAMLPIFEEKVLEHRDGHYIVQDWMGAITEIADNFDYTYIRSARDFVTRKWHKFPVETREDWARMQERFQLDTPGRFGENFAARCRERNTHDAVITMQINGPFWQLREWCGFENLCIFFLDEPEFVQEMIDFWTDFVAQMLARIGEHSRIDRLGISEDMAYKAHSMISPAMTRRHLQPTYERWVAQATQAGCRVIDMDSDGYIGELIPIWIDAGINVCDPIEVAAHNDLLEFRQRFGKKMGYTGGVDKRAIAAGGAVMEAELARLTPVIRDGGYIPGCDHGVPPDISWPDYLAYSRRLAELCGWL